MILLAALGWAGSKLAPPSLTRAQLSSVSATAQPAYWLAGRDGGVFAFHAPFLGSMGGTKLAQPVVGMAADPVTGGYWLVAADGGVFAFHAPFLGSMGVTKLAQPIVGMAATPDGGGYWLVAADGGVFSFGSSAVFSGSMAGTKLAQPVVGMAFDPSTGGYWLVGGDGGVFAFNASPYGSTEFANRPGPVAGIGPAIDGRGYWIATRNGQVRGYGPSSPSEGSVATVPIAGAIAAITTRPSPAWKVQPVTGNSYNWALVAVSCPTPDGCVAVGSSGYHEPPFLETRPFAFIHSPQNGWTPYDLPEGPGGSGQVSSVSCTGPAYCMAVGSFTPDGQNPTTLAEAWTGASWAQLPPYTPSSGSTATFSGVSCASTTWCVVSAAISSQGSGATQHFLLWDGQSWSDMQSPPEGDFEHWLAEGGVSCPSTTFCLAVGALTPMLHGGTTPFAETWNGSAWALVPVPEPSESLTSVSCTTATFCETVGYYHSPNSTLHLPYAADWDGSGLHRQRVLFRGDLYAVSCATTYECHAVGTGQQDTWDGSNWYASTTGPEVNPLSCAAPGSCTAVGSTATAEPYGNNLSPLIQTIGS